MREVQTQITCVLLPQRDEGPQKISRARAKRRKIMTFSRGRSALHLAFAREIS